MKPDMIVYTWKNLGSLMLQEQIYNNNIKREDFDEAFRMIAEDTTLSDHMKMWAKRDYERLLYRFK